MHGNVSGYGAARPAHMGRELVINAIGHIQHIEDPAIDLQAVTESLAKATGSLYASRNLEVRNPSHVALIMKSMDELRLTYRLLKQGSSSTEHLADALSAVARTLAVLYPVSQVKTFRRHRAGLIQASLQHNSYPDTQRVTVRASLETHVGFQSGVNFCIGMSGNISTDGIYIATHDTRPPGTPINLNFNLPNGYFVSVNGTSQWFCTVDTTTQMASSGMGVSFHELADEDRKEIARFVSPPQVTTQEGESATP